MPFLSHGSVDSSHLSRNLIGPVVFFCYFKFAEKGDIWVGELCSVQFEMSLDHFTDGGSGSTERGTFHFFVESPFLDSLLARR